MGEDGKPEFIADDNPETQMERNWAKVKNSAAGTRDSRKNQRIRTTMRIAIYISSLVFLMLAVRFLLAQGRLPAGSVKVSDSCEAERQRAVYAVVEETAGNIIMLSRIPSMNSRELENCVKIMHEDAQNLGVKYKLPGKFIVNPSVQEWGNAVGNSTIDMRNAYSIVYISQYCKDDLVVVALFDGASTTMSHRDLPTWTRPSDAIR